MHDITLPIQKYCHACVTTEREDTNKKTGITLPAAEKAQKSSIGAMEPNSVAFGSAPRREADGPRRIGRALPQGTP